MSYRQRPRLPFNPADNRKYVIEGFPRQAIPTVVGLLMKRTVRNGYQTPGETNGADMVARAIMSIYISAIEPSATVIAINQLYRLLANVLLGTQYATTIVNGLEVANPPIPMGNPDWAAQSGLSLLELTRRTRYVLENGLLGITSPGLTDIRDFRTQLDELIAKQTGGALDDEQLAELVKIGLALA